MATACALCACDPVEEDDSFSAIEYTKEAVSEAFSFTQADKAGKPAADGNYFTYTTNPAQIVKVFNYKADGSENQLALGASGTFQIAPSRGSDPNVKFYVATYNADGTRVVAEKTANVFVKAELTPTERLFCSDLGRKVYKWNTRATDGAFWGNMGYCGGDGSEVYKSGAGKWWGVDGVNEVFDTQLQHSVTGNLTGEESVNAYMVFTEDGTIEKYDENGAKLNETTYEVVAQPNEERAAWAPYILKTGENSVLWPFEINAGGKYVTEFEVVYVSPTAMTLVYPDGGAFDGLGGWGEATFWQFKADDYEGAIVGVEGKGKSWTWNPDAPDGQVWGNMGTDGYQDGTKFGLAGEGKWWGVTSEEEFADQLQHSVTGELTGEESFDAYFTLTEDGTLKKYDGNGKLLNTCKWALNTDKASAPWRVGVLETGENSVLWPFEINGGGKYVTEFDVVYADADRLTLVYPDGGKFEGWQEASFWQFKAKE